MDKKIKQKWINALRSGEYRQGKFCLSKKDEDGNMKYCCLGVLTHLINPNHPDLKIKCEDGRQKSYGALLPSDIMEVAGLSSNDPKVKKNNCNTSLAGLNDDKSSFEEIADVIEEQL